MTSQRNVIIFFIALTSFHLTSCRNYNSEEYLKMEEQAINELIPMMTDLQYMTKANHAGIDSLKLYIISSLDTTIYPPHFPTNDLDINYQDDLRRYNKENRLFAPIINGTLKKRSIQNNFTCKGLIIDLAPLENSMDLAKNPDVLGVLTISRIYFERGFKKGYLSYTFYCGTGCCWSNNVEIRKIDGKWIFSEIFSGGIA
ncbi:hypothetical protein FUAX_01550 [Fulvitalea axinellae]|uniref:Lipoprotein n=1 Tax=Fulvitalea axinellae TaxID=1182444 RepID=A0AAU9CD92_9BACT|nr:hypothetical protein FUAX_01550 [Fulvitalea axinellae]